jgi:hypothetical protein
MRIVLISPILITFFKLNGNQIKSDGHLKIKEMVATTTSNDNIILEAGNFFYFINGRGELIQVSKRGKVQNLTEGMGYINSTFAKTSDNKIVFAMSEKPGKLFVYSQGNITSVDFPVAIGLYETNLFMTSLPNNNLVFQGSDSLVLLDSQLKVLKQVDLKALKGRSMITQLKVINESYVSLVVFGFYYDIDSFVNGTVTDRGQGVLLFDLNLDLKHNLIKQDGSFTPLDAGSVSAEDILYAGDHKNIVQKFELKK